MGVALTLGDIAAGEVRVLVLAATLITPVLAVIWHTAAITGTTR
jgi:hypothetical protein